MNFQIEQSQSEMSGESSVMNRRSHKNHYLKKPEVNVEHISNNQIFGDSISQKKNQHENICDLSLKSDENSYQQECSNQFKENQQHISENHQYIPNQGGNTSYQQEKIQKSENKQNIGNGSQLIEEENISAQEESINKQQVISKSYKNQHNEAYLKDQEQQQQENAELNQFKISEINKNEPQIQKQQQVQQINFPEALWSIEESFKKMSSQITLSRYYMTQWKQDFSRQFESRMKEAIKQKMTESLQDVMKELKGNKDMLISLTMKINSHEDKLIKIEKNQQEIKQMLKNNQKNRKIKLI